MFQNEAARLRAILLDRPDISPLLNLGSSTHAFRTVTKPHIDAELFEPLRQAGIVLVHSDLKQGDGIDMTGDILDADFRDQLKARRFRVILLSNMLEHVVDRDAVAAACEDIVGPGGLILATVPSSYPYHADPIDTGYRPTPTELAALFRRSTAVITEEIVDGSYADRLAAQGLSPWQALALTALWVLIAPVRPRSAAARVDRWFWYRRPYRVAIVLMEVRGGRIQSPPP